jgi:hypothetical protein
MQITALRVLVTLIFIGTGDNMIRYFYSRSFFIRVFVASLLGICLSLATTFATLAQPAALSAVASAKVLSDFIDDARASAEQLLLSGEVVADRQVRNAANQMLIVTRELEIALGDQLDKTVSDLDAIVKASLGQVEGLQLALENKTDQVTDAFDDLSLDIAEILGDTILAEHSFVLQRIDGVAQLYSEADYYNLDLLGSSFGIRSVELTKIVLDGSDVTDDIFKNSVSQHRITLIIKGEQLNALFDLSDDPSQQVIKTVPIEFSLTRSSEAPWWRIWSRDDDQIEIIHQVYLYLIPPFAGEVNLNYLGEGFEWADNGVFDFTHTSAGNHCQGACDTDDRGDWPISQHGASSQQQTCVTQRRETPLREGDEYLTAARHGGGPGFNPTEVRITQGGHCLFFRVISRTHAHAYSVLADKKKWVKLPDPIELGAESLSVAFGKTYRVTAPENTVSTLFAFDPLGPVLEQTGELNLSVNNSAMRVVSSETIGSRRVITFTVMYP